MDRQEGDLLGIDFGKMISDAAKGVSDFIVKTGDDITKAIDQNGDGSACSYIHVRLIRHPDYILNLT